ncbi:hypothetical protein P7C70_g5781, partial [Phenoliferia sp. Uapishka_3]
MESSTPESFAVLGGEGFVGQAIIQSLLSNHPPSAVASFGLTQRTFFPPSYRFFHTDVTSYSAVLSSLKLSGATTVFHTVSPHPTASKEMCEKVNVQGTKAILEACREAGVRKLVFTSSVTVCFDGKDIVNCDERLPKVEGSRDPYVATKAAAEALVIEANGKGGLLTCALRFGGIFGPGDRQCIPGLIKVYHDSQTSFQMGYNLNLFDFIHIDNVVHAHILAAERLSSPPISPSIFEDRLPPVYSSIPYRFVPTSLQHSPSSLKAPAPDPLPAMRHRFDQFAFLSPSSHSASPPSDSPLLSVAGETFIISNGEPIAFWSFARAVWHEYANHVPRVVIPLPVGLGLMMASVAEWFAWLRGDTSGEGLTRVHVSYVVCGLYFDIEKVSFSLRRSFSVERIAEFMLGDEGEESTGL